MFRLHPASGGACAALALAWATSIEAKPIAFANGTTVMAEYGAGTMIEGQAFYAPTYWLSVGGGYVHFETRWRLIHSCCRLQAMGEGLRPMTLPLAVPQRMQAAILACSSLISASRPTFARLAPRPT